MTRIHPSISPSFSNTQKNNRPKVMLRWMGLISGFPLAYMIMPVSCCIRNPASKVLYDNEDHITDDGDPCINRMTENLVVV